MIIDYKKLKFFIIHMRTKSTFIYNYIFNNMHKINYRTYSEFHTANNYTSSELNDIINVT